MIYEKEFTAGPDAALDTVAGNFFEERYPGNVTVRHHRILYNHLHHASNARVTLTWEAGPVVQDEWLVQYECLGECRRFDIIFILD